MTALSRAVGRLARLPKPETRRVVVDRAIDIPMPDGAVLKADRWYGDTPAGRAAPILLSRTPYGRKVEGLYGQLFAERGYQVVLVSCRGTFDSQGVWEPFFNEQRDGHAVLEWLARQPWFSGRVGLFGGSYVGLTQWAVAGDAPDFVRAMSPTITSSNFRTLMYPGESFALETASTWVYGLHYQADGLLRTLWTGARNRKPLARAARTAPLADADVAMVGEHIPPFQDWLAHDAPGDPWWERVDFSGAVRTAPPALVTAGWFDIFAKDQIADYVALRAAGRDARLRVGAWGHGSGPMVALNLRETLAWMDAHVRERGLPPGDRVELFDIGAKTWRGFEEWPPPATTTAWHLQPAGGLSTDAPPATAAPDRYRYDPNDPTPGVGGATLNGRNGKPVDNRKVEARPDVLTYTTEPLDRDVTVAGPVRAELHLRSSLEHTDFFVRLCDVDAKGRSVNLCDGIRRLRPGDRDVARNDDGTFALTLELSPTANTFRRGHRIRLQVASGAHPIYARNPGSGEPLAKATTFVVADQEVHHDGAHPSALILPVL